MRSSWSTYEPVFCKALAGKQGAVVEAGVLGQRVRCALLVGDLCLKFGIPVRRAGGRPGSPCVDYALCVS